MKLLIVSATKFEVAPLLERMETIRKTDGRLICCTYKKFEIDFIITGVGMVATAYYAAKAINDSYDLALNLGVCGSFNQNLEIGTVVNIYEDQFSELGAEDGDAFLTLSDLKLEGVSKITNNSGAINVAIETLPRVTGITVNTTHGSEKSIAAIYDRLHPFVESMEGAAFMYACENESIPYAQIRAVSNMVERRNKDAWNLPLAIGNLNMKMIEILDNL